MVPLIHKTSEGGWLVDEAGGVYTLGKAPFYGSFVDHIVSGEKIVAGAQNGTGNYYVITDAGSIHSAGMMKESLNFFGTQPRNISHAAISSGRVAVIDAGELVVKRLSDIAQSGTREQRYELDCTSPVSGVAFDLVGEGIYVLNQNGQVQVFAGAKMYGDFLEEKIDARAVSIAIRPWGCGYWIVDEMGGIFCFGDADYFGSVPGDGSRIDAVAITAHSTGRGYWITDRQGHVLPFGYADAYPNLNELPNSPIVSFIPEELIRGNGTSTGVSSIVESVNGWLERRKEFKNEGSK